MSRFTFDGSDAPVANGTIASGATRGVALSPDGAVLYVTGASNVIRLFDVATGSEATPVTLATTGSLHFLAVRQGQLYVAALADDKVYRYDIAGDDSLTFVEGIDSPSPGAVAFGEDETEMFVSGHKNSFIVARFAYDAGTDGWTRAGEIDVGVSLGGLAILPTR